MDCFVLASHNKKKADELRSVLHAAAGIRLLTLADFPGAPEPEENGRTFEENAMIKAHSARAHTGFAAIADDSGLMADALGGAPGVYSARFAGEKAGDAANNRLLLERMAGVPAGKRGAKFVSVVAVVTPDGQWGTFRGETRGTILESLRGESGFGYDPLFLSDDLGVSFAEAGREEKNRVSHRARALEKFLKWYFTDYSRPPDGT